MRKVWPFLGIAAAVAAGVAVAPLILPALGAIVGFLVVVVVVAWKPVLELVAILIGFGLASVVWNWCWAGFLSWDGSMPSLTGGVRRWWIRRRHQIPPEAPR